METRSWFRPQAGDTIVWCSVPLCDFEMGLFYTRVVDRVNGETVILDDGSRTSVHCCWPSVDAIGRHVDEMAEVSAVDARLSRYAA